MTDLPADQPEAPGRRGGSPDASVHGPVSETAPAHTAPSVRLALPVEARDIAAIQRRAWLSSTAMQGIAEGLSLDHAAELWWQAIARPPMAHYRVLVAVQPRESTPAHGATPDIASQPAQHSRQVVCGFAAVGPSDDPDAENDDLLVAEFCVDEAARGLGHDDRLMNAVADTARADGYRRLTWWIPSTDDSLRAWLQESGWAPDGAHREVGTEDAVGETVPTRVKQVRMHTDISAPSAPEAV